MPETPALHDQGDHAIDRRPVLAGLVVDQVEFVIRAHVFLPVAPRSRLDHALGISASRTGVRPRPVRSTRSVSTTGLPGSICSVETRTSIAS